MYPAVRFIGLAVAIAIIYFLNSLEDRISNKGVVIFLKITKIIVIAAFIVACVIAINMRHKL